MKESKKCWKCGEEKELSYFCKNKNIKGGFDPRCKQCAKNYYKENRGILLEQKKGYYKDNKDKIKSRVWSKRHTSDEETKRKDRDRYNNYVKRRKKSDPLYKLRDSLSSRTLSAFKRSSWVKGAGTEKLLGATYQEVMEYIGSQFTDGMEWSNHGEWHIDHIKPLGNATTEEEMIKRCHYKNLQPLWALENLSKGNMTPKQWDDYRGTL